MYAKLITGAAAILAAVLFAYLGNRIINAYGEARYQSGLADGRLNQLPQILAASDKAAQAGLDARDRVIAADGAHDAVISRLIPQILSAQDRVTAYAASTAGRADCLGPDRVRGIEADRRTLFPPSAADRTSLGTTGPLPTEPVADANGS